METMGAIAMDRDNAWSLIYYVQKFHGHGTPLEEQRRALKRYANALADLDDVVRLEGELWRHVVESRIKGSK